MYFLDMYMTEEDEVKAKALQIYEALKIGEFESLEFPAISFILGNNIAYKILNEEND